jgi:hypothetical protein
MENAIYWNGRQVGIECAGRDLWFSSAPRNAIAAYGTQRPTEERAVAGDRGMACNLVVIARYDRLDFGA